MERQEHLTLRRVAYRKRKQEVRQEQLMVSYIKAKYPMIYREANDYYSTLNEIHPNINDLRKTWRFKEFVSSTKTRDNMVLKIPFKITPKDKEVEDKEIHEVEAVEANDIFPDIDLNTLVSEIPPQMIEEIIKDLRADPNLASIMNDVEADDLNMEADALDIDLDIPDDLLEKELTW